MRVLKALIILFVFAASGAQASFFADNTSEDFAAYDKKMTALVNAYSAVKNGYLSGVLPEEQYRTAMADYHRQSVDLGIEFLNSGTDELSLTYKSEIELYYDIAAQRSWQEAIDQVAYALVNRRLVEKNTVVFVKDELIFYSQELCNAIYEQQRVVIGELEDVLRLSDSMLYARIQSQNDIKAHLDRFTRLYPVIQKQLEDLTQAEDSSASEMASLILCNNIKNSIGLFTEGGILIDSVSRERVEGAKRAILFACGGFDDDVTPMKKIDDQFPYEKPVSELRKTIQALKPIVISVRKTTFDIQLVLDRDKKELAENFKTLARERARIANP